MGLIDDATVERIRAIFIKANLPATAPDLGAENYLHMMGLDKKVEGGRIRFVLLKRIGAAFLSADVAATALNASLTGYVVHA